MIVENFVKLKPYFASKCQGAMDFSEGEKLSRK
jgi:hypothetical protein